MDMFREILGFYDVVEDHELKSGAIALFFALLHRANRNGWKEWFIVSSKKLEALSGQGKTTVWSNLKVLKACGLIDYRTAKGAKTEFKIIPTRSKYEPLPEPVSEQEPEQLPEQEPEPPLIERAEDVDVDNSLLPEAAGAATGEKEKKGKKGKRVYEPDDRRYKCAAWLDADIAKKTPGSKRATEAQLQNWADTFRLMEERDGILMDNIIRVLMWARKDDRFWSGVVLSAGNLRENYNKILAKMKQEKSNGNGKGGNAPAQQQQPERRLGEGLKGGATGLD